MLDRRVIPPDVITQLGLCHSREHCLARTRYRVATQIDEVILHVISLRGTFCSLRCWRCQAPHSCKRSGQSWRAVGADGSLCGRLPLSIHSADIGSAKRPASSASAPVDLETAVRKSAFGKSHMRTIGQNRTVAILPQSRHLRMSCNILESLVSTTFDFNSKLTPVALCLYRTLRLFKSRLSMNIQPALLGFDFYCIAFFVYRNTFLASTTTNNEIHIAPINASTVVNIRSQGLAASYITSPNPRVANVVSDK